MSRRKNGTFGKAIQINKPEDFALVAKNGFFSMVYAPYEGRLIEYFPDPQNVLDTDSRGFIEWKDQKHVKHVTFFSSDDFEIPSEVVLSEMRETEQGFESEVLASLFTDLIFEPNLKRAKLILTLIKAYSQVTGLEHVALNMAPDALATRKVVRSLVSL